MNTHFPIRDFLLSRPNSPFLQFVKYAICGGFSAFIMYGTIIVLNLTLPDYVNHSLHDPETLAKHTNVFNTVGFIPSSLVAYLTNRAFVFTPGKHSVWMEFGIFSFIALISFIGGKYGSDWVIQYFQVPSFVGSLAFGVSSAMINFVCRKFIIFKG